ncbi:MAG TPA: ATP-NAD kinase family protein [Candidatus Thermoplasmatota archaeon]|nr:ATP-NAD kinase family protein [Candidatus Thermoplasmatota archaeon]
MRVGLLVNPVAGLGGRVGLKGTDGAVAEALRRGAVARAGDRAVEFLRALPENVEIATCAGAMGERACEAAGASAIVAHVPAEPTSANDTREAAAALAELPVDVLAFVGGDGTAQDVLAAVGERVPALGVPAGVKMHSACFAPTPREAAAILAEWDGRTELRDVLDADEGAIRSGRMEVRLAGRLRVPASPRVPPGKSPAPPGDEEVAHAIVHALSPGVTWILGPGGTLHDAKRLMGLDATLLGLDAVRDGRQVAKDASERELVALPDPLGLVVAPIGGQGFVIGRGNAPLSPAVLARIPPDRLVVAAGEEKLRGLPCLRVDTQDPALDARFPAWIRVLVAPGRTKLVRVEGGNEKGQE